MLLKRIHKNTTVHEVMSDPEFVKDIDRRKQAVESERDTPACKRMSQAGDDVHSWIEVGEVKLSTVKDLQAEFFKYKGD